MRAVVQRVSRASVRVQGDTLGEIGLGYMVLLGVEDGDTAQDAAYMADKIAGLRVFEDEQEKMNLTLDDVGGAVLLISQFTLLGDARKGRRPSFIRAARPELAVPLYESVRALLEEKGIKVRMGSFGAHMEVELVNDGPVTLLLESRKLF